MDERRRVSVTARSSAVFVGIALTAVLAVLFVSATQRVLIWAMIALFLALALDHAVELLGRVLPRRVAVLVVFVGAVLAIAGVGLLVVPPLVDQVRDFAVRLPSIIEKLSRGRGPLGFLEDRFNVVERVQRTLQRNGAGGLLGLTGPVFTAVAGVVQTVIGVLAVTFLTLFMLLHGPSWWRAWVGFVPDAQRPLWERIGELVYHAIGGWVIGAIVIALLAGTSATVVLLVLGVQYALAIGLIVALLDPIPFVGATLAGVVGGLVTLATDGLTAALIFAGFLVVYQQVVENHVLVPTIYGRTVELDALAVLLAVLLGGELAGIIGAIAAVPIAGALKAIVGEVLRWRRGRAKSESAQLVRVGASDTEDPHGPRSPAGQRGKAERR